MPTKRAFASVLVCFFAVVLVATAAEASPVAIGQFFVSNPTDPSDPLYGLGPIFTVTNDSGADPSLNGGGTFTNVNLFLDGNSDPTAPDFAFGTVNVGDAPDSSWQDLSYAQSSAVITLDLVLPGLDPIAITTTALTDLSLGTTDSITIYYDPSTQGPTSVPEPGTLVLLGTGVATVIARKRRQHAS